MSQPMHKHLIMYVVNYVHDATWQTYSGIVLVLEQVWSEFSTTVTIAISTSSNFKPILLMQWTVPSYGR